jgi:hypothetical protein
MALTFKASVIAEETGTFTVQDTTGVYTSNNPTGYGAPNPQIIYFTSADLTVSVPEPETFLPAPTPVTYSINMYPTLPNTGSPLYYIDYSMLGGNAANKCPDGVYEFTYEAYDDDNGDLYTWNGSVLMYANTLCCLANLAIAGTNSGCGCGCGSKMSRFEKGMLMLEAAKYATSCNNTTAAAKALLAASELCNGCKDC